MAKKSTKKVTGKKAAKKAGGAKRGSRAAAAAAAAATAAKVARPPRHVANTPKQERGIAWIDRVKCPVQRALARAVPRACALFGIDDPTTLFERVPAKKDDFRTAAANSYRESAIGVIALLGLDLGLAWADLHARAGESGRTQVQYLYPAHRWSLKLFASRVAAVMGRTLEDSEAGSAGAHAGAAGAAGEPMGDIGWWLRERFASLLAAARVDAGTPALPLGDAA